MTVRPEIDNNSTPSESQLTAFESEPQPDPTIFRLSSSAEKRKQTQTKSVCIVTRFPGPAAYFMSVAKDMATAGVDVYFAVTEQAESITRKTFSENSSTFDLELVDKFPQVDWALISADTPTTFESVAIAKLREQNPQLKVAACEDTVNSIANLLMEVAVDLVFTTTRHTAQLYRESYPNLAHTPIVPIGQPVFDNVKQVYEELRREKRQSLDQLLNPENGKQSPTVLTYFGVPEFDFPSVEIAIEGKTVTRELNTFALEKFLDAVSELALNNPQTQYIFIYKAHPRSLMQDHPLLEQMRLKLAENNIANIEIVHHDSAAWSAHGLDTKSLSACSDVVLTTVSTMGQEVALAADTISSSAPSPVLYIPEEYFSQAGDRRSLEGPVLLQQLGAAVVIRNSTELPARLAETVMIRNMPKETTQPHSSLAREYRLKSRATPRILRWLDARLKTGE